MLMAGRAFDWEG